MLLNGQAAHQAGLFATRFVWHLRELRGLGVDQHLREEKMENWLGAVRGLEPYFRRDDVAWGELGVISAGRWRDNMQYQAARRLLTHGLGLNQRSLRRRFDERAYWGRADELRVN